MGARKALLLVQALGALTIAIVVVAVALRNGDAGLAVVFGAGAVVVGGIFLWIARRRESDL